MGWTNPRTWLYKELVDQTEMNTEVRDNLNYLYAASNVFARNLIYNGAMQISQRSAVGTAQTGKTADGYYTADRWNAGLTSGGTWTQSVEADAPAGSGLTNSLKMACTTATGALGTTNIAKIEQRLEGQDCQRIAKGSASAQQLTLSFWVKSTTTGSYIAELEDRNNTRFVSAAYTINSANTWEQKTITFPADTTGVLSNNANESLRVNFWLVAGTNYTSGTLGATWNTTTANRAVGQVNVGAANTNTWQLTGVQLETGSVNTTFEFLPFGEELRRCQRYYYSVNIQYLPMGPNTFYANGSMWVPYPVTMRATPSSTMSANAFKTGDNAATAISAGPGTNGDEKAFRASPGGGAWASVYNGSVTATAEL